MIRQKSLEQINVIDVELEEIKKVLTPRDGEENQEINDIPVIEERIQNEMAQWSPARQTRECCIQIKIGSINFYLE